MITSPKKAIHFRPSQRDTTLFQNRGEGDDEKLSHEAEEYFVNMEQGTHTHTRKPRKKIRMKLLSDGLDLLLLGCW